MNFSRLFKFGSYSIRCKILVGVIFIVSLILAALFWSLIEIYEAKMVNVIKGEALKFSLILEHDLRFDMLSGEAEKLQDEILSLGDAKRDMKVRIISPQHVIVMSNNPAELGMKITSPLISQIPLDKPLRIVSHQIEKDEGESFISVATTMPNETPCQECHGVGPPINGIIQLSFPLREVSQAIVSNRRMMMKAALLTITFLVISLAFFLNRCVTRRIRRLSSSMQIAKAGQYEAQAPTSPPDELGQLGETFNQLIQEIKSRENELERIHQKKVQHLERLATLGEISAGVAHEVGNPLAAILAAAQVLQEEIPNNKNAQEYLTRIIKEVRRLDHFVKVFASYARPREPVLTTVNVSQILKGVLTLLKEQIPAQGIEIVTDYNSSLPPLEADSQQLHQVFLNLILNALQAMPSGGKLIIKASPAHLPQGDASEDKVNAVEISITDTGKGIPSGQLEKIFNPFFTTRPKGTGLGLSIVQQIVTAHGGQIQVKSQPGLGTIFKVLLPSASPAPMLETHSSELGR